MLLTFNILFNIFFLFPFNGFNNISSFFDAITHEVLTRKFYIKTVKKVYCSKKIDIIE